METFLQPRLAKYAVQAWIVAPVEITSSIKTTWSGTWKNGGIQNEKSRDSLSIFESRAWCFPLQIRNMA